MKLIRRRIERDLSGEVTLRLEEDEDMWHAYNLIQEGDQVRATAIRRIISESSTGSTESHRVRTNLTILVEKIVFSASPQTSSGSTSTNPSDPSTSTDPAPPTPAASNASTSGQTTLHISGRVSSESQYVKMGAFHTLDLEIGRDFTVIKGEGEWDSVGLERVKEATEMERGAEVGAVVCGEGLANVFLITNHTTLVKQRIEVSVPRKRKGAASLGVEKATDKFHQQIYQSILRHFDLDVLKVIIIASPGFVAESVMKYIFQEAARTGNKPLLTAKPKFMLLPSPSHHVHSLMQVLSSPEVSARLKDTKFAREGQALDRFFKMLDTDELRAWYGEGHVFKAAERGAIGTLLITDNLFRSPDPSRRKKFVKLIEDIKTVGGETMIFSSMHESGQQLDSMTGVAAILTYPLDIEVVEEEERQEKLKEEEEERKGEEEGGTVNGAT